MSCFSCQGKNVCYSCKGAGGKMLGYGGYARYIRCFSCNGSGTCGRCHGAGSTLVGRYITISDTDKNPNRVKRPNGYAEIYSNSKGSTEISYTKCSWCQGLNTCKACNGAGLRNIGSNSYPRYENCHACFGKGTCSSCDNNGMVKQVYTVNKESGQAMYVNETTGFVSSGNIYDQENSSSSSSSSGSSKVGGSSSGSGTKKLSVCTGCKGRRKICVDVPLTLGEIYYCSFCGHKGYGKHMQRSCYQCGGLGNY